MQATILRFLGAVILLAIAALAVQAVEGDTLWTCNYGGEWHEMAHALCSTDDGGCVLAGYTQHDYAGPQNMYAVRVNAQGDTLWTEEYGSDMYEKAYAICPAPDGGYVLAGHTNEFSTWSDMDVVKISSEGLAEWSRHYGGELYETAYSICPAADGYLVAGESGSYTDGGLYLVRIDAVGNELWSQAYGEDVARACCAIPSESGGFMVVGYTERYGIYNQDFYLLRVDEVGDTLWSFMFGGDESDVAMSVCPSGDGGFMVAGYTASYGAGSWDMYVVKANDQGDTLWTRTYGGALDERANAICPSGDGGFLLTGYTGSTSSGYPDVYLIKINALGDTLWTHTYGNDRENKGLALCLSSDEAILVAGYTQPTIGSYFDMYLLKIAGAGSAVPPLTPPLCISSFQLHNPHPNPFNASTVLNFDLPVASRVTLEVFDVSGRVVTGVGARQTSPLPSGSGATPTMYSSGRHQIAFDGSDLPSGVYLARLTVQPSASVTTPTTAVQKLVLLK